MRDCNGIILCFSFSSSKNQLDEITEIREQVGRAKGKSIKMKKLI